MAISGEREVRVQTLRNNPGVGQQGAAGVRRERAKWTQCRHIYQDNCQVLLAGVGTSRFSTPFVVLVKLL